MLGRGMFCEWSFLQQNEQYDSKEQSRKRKFQLRVVKTAITTKKSGNLLK
jgi:hypothetical protein